MQSALGSSTEGMTPVLAAKWTITSAPSAARSARSSSVMSPATSSTRSPEEIGPGSSVEISTKSLAAARSSRVPTAKLSTTLTAWPPSSIRDRIRAVPIKPQPPVTSQFTKPAPARVDLPTFSYSNTYLSLPSVACRAYIRPTLPPARVWGHALRTGALFATILRLVRFSREGPCRWTRRRALLYGSAPGTTPWLALASPEARSEGAHAGAHAHAQGLSQGGRRGGRRGYHARRGRVRQPGQQRYTSARRVPSERGIENERDTGDHRQPEKRPPRRLRQRLDKDPQPRRPRQGEPALRPLVPRVPADHPGAARDPHGDKNVPVQGLAEVVRRGRQPLGLAAYPKRTGYPRRDPARRRLLQPDGHRHAAPVQALLRHAQGLPRLRLHQGPGERPLQAPVAGLRGDHAPVLREHRGPPERGGLVRPAGVHQGSRVPGDGEGEPAFLHVGRQLRPARAVGPATEVHRPLQRRLSRPRARHFEQRSLGLAHREPAEADARALLRRGNDGRLLAGSLPGQGGRARDSGQHHADTALGPRARFRGARLRRQGTRCALSRAHRHHLLYQAPRRQGGRPDERPLRLHPRCGAHDTGRDGPRAPPADGGPGSLHRARRKGTRPEAPLYGRLPRPRLDPGREVRHVLPLQRFRLPPLRPGERPEDGQEHRLVEPRRGEENVRRVHNQGRRRPLAPLLIGCASMQPYRRGKKTIA